MVILDFLESIGEGEKWFCGIGESGQKHVLPMCSMGRGEEGAIMFEERSVRLGDLRGFECFRDMEHMLAMKSSKAEIVGMKWSMMKMSKNKEYRDAAFAFHKKWSSDVGGTSYELQMFLARHPEKEIK